MTPSTAPAPSSDLLPVGTQLMWYEIRQALGRGGFAVTYLAQDSHLQQLFAIKEYLPSGLAHRSDTGVAPNPGSEENFTWGRERFLAEARTLARFKHPNIVRVVSFFEANNTAYLVMDFEEGQSLAQSLALNPAIDEAALMRLVLPLMEGLAVLHQEGFIHRDIKPDNIYLRRDGSPVLLDFGAARHALGGQTQNLTSLLSPGYAPLEQYFSQKDRQGPWSDIYALGAVLYRIVAGQKPPEASLRSNYLINGMEDPLKPARQVGLGRYSTRLLDAIDRSLRLREDERPQSLAEWRQMLPGPAAVAEVPTVAQSPRRVPPASSAPLASQAPAATRATARPTIRPSSRPEPSAGGRKFLYLALGLAFVAVAALKPWRAPATGTPVQALAPQPGEQREEASEAPPSPPQERLSVADLRDEPPPPMPRGPVADVTSAAPAERPLRPPLYPEPGQEQYREPSRPQPGLARQQFGETERPQAGDGRRGEQLDPSMQACRGDAERYCPGIMPGDGRLAACLRENMHQFSPACRALVQDRLRGGLPRRPPPGER